jgi:inner membrane protein
MNTQPTLSFWQKNKLVIKAFFIAFLILALLIPTFIIMYLVNERKERKQEVTREISNKWSAAQTITGPFLIIPYTENASNNGNAVTVKKDLYLLPEQLNINGTIEPEIRYRSIYKVPVFTAKPITLSGKFAKHNFNTIGINPVLLKWNEAKLCIGISDLKGIKQQTIKWNNQLLNMESGLPENNIVWQGISVPVELDASFIDKENSFSVQLTLQGSEKLYCTPLGSNTTARFNSSWINPAFDGKYLPDTETVNSKGFEASWSVSQFNRDFPKILTGNSSVSHAVSKSAFGIILLSPFDAYAQTMRSLKYAILIIALTFFAYFFTEIFQRRPVHPLQYILIGMALVIFYILLLSISEYIQFPIAYLTAPAVFLKN